MNTIPELIELQNKGYFIPEIGDYIKIDYIYMPIARVVEYFFLPRIIKGSYQTVSQPLIGVVVHSKFKDKIVQTGGFSSRTFRRGKGQSARNRIRRHEKGGDRYFFGVAPRMSMRKIDHITVLANIDDLAPP